MIGYPNVNIPNRVVINPVTIPQAPATKSNAAVNMLPPCPPGQPFRFPVDVGLNPLLVDAAAPWAQAARSSTVQVSEAKARDARISPKWVSTAAGGEKGHDE